MITAVFQNNDDYAHAYGLWQWDYGQQLRIEGLHLPTAVEIHFALQETGGEAIPRVGTTKDGITTVTIPDSMLEGNSAAWTAEKTYNIYAWVYLSDKLSGETIKRITMQVKSRPKPEAFDAPGDGEIFHQAIEAVNDAAKRAEEAGDKAVVAADEAKEAATQTAEHLQATEGLAEQVETNADTVAQDKQTVAGMLSQTQQAASDAALSAQAAKLSETAAGQAQTGAEAAEDTARQYAEETGADRQAVANDKQAVSQMREAVAADRKAVEQTTAQFGQTSQDALTAIGQAQSTAVGAVKAEGNKQTTAVQEAGTQAVSEVTEAKTTAVQAVTTEGDKQTKRVEDAAAGIVADREQIGQNKTDIAGLVEGMTDLAPAILNTASGSVITADDAAEGRPFRGLRVFGKSTQDGTPTPEVPAPIVNVGEGGSITMDVTGKNLLPFPYVDGMTKTTNGITFTVNADRSITCTGTAINQAFFNLSKQRYTANPTDFNKYYSALDCRYDHSNNITHISVSKSDGYVNKTIYPMVVKKGETNLDYEPPRAPQSLTLATPNGLPGVPVSKDGNYTDADGQQWVCDEIDLERGKYVQRVKEVNPADYDDWILDDSTEPIRFKVNRIPDTINERKRFEVLSNRFVFNSENKVGVSFAYADEIYFYLPSTVTTVEQAKQWFVDNPTTLMYMLGTPIEINLTPEEIAAYKALRTYGPTTVITNDAGAGMEVTYVADTKAYIDKKFKELNQAIVNTQIALL